MPFDSSCGSLVSRHVSTMFLTWSASAGKSINLTVIQMRTYWKSNTHRLSTVMCGRCRDSRDQRRSPRAWGLGFVFPRPHQPQPVSRPSIHSTATGFDRGWIE
ncbi:hypothetical protein V6N11_080788 [Hibiscus sabdariffa]|uniref:Uncharacterized protein n=1 Tax=Hibiscus sabdariffa TaxID=183260 RepID=A0ABR2QHX2_9ROSI